MHDCLLKLVARYVLKPFIANTVVATWQMCCYPIQGLIHEFSAGGRGIGMRAICTCYDVTSHNIVMKTVLFTPSRIGD